VTCVTAGFMPLVKVKKDQYKSISQLTPLVDNLVYYCKLNHCAVVNKRLLHDHHSFVTQAADVPSICSLQAEQTNLHCIYLLRLMIFTLKILAYSNKSQVPLYHLLVLPMTIFLHYLNPQLYPLLVLLMS